MEERRKITVADVHLEKGNIFDNPRLINQSHLSEVAPNFIPQLIVPDDKVNQLTDDEYEYKGFTFPVEKIDGPQWAMMLGQSQIEWKGRILVFTFKDHVSVTKQTLEQMQFLYEKFKVLLTDRNETNVLLKVVEDKDDPQKWSYQVYQTDFSVVYDTVSSANFIASTVDLKTRVNVTEEDIKDQDLTKKNLAHQLRFLVGRVAEIATNSTFTNSLSEEIKEIISDFERSWDQRGISKTGQYLDFAAAQMYLSKVLSKMN